MQCGSCGENLKKKTKKVKSGIFGIASIMELVAVVFGGLAFAYPPALPYKSILISVAIFFALIGHFLMYKKVKFMWCKSCKAEVEVNT